MMSHFWGRALLVLPAFLLLRTWELIEGDMFTQLQVGMSRYIAGALFSDVVFFFFVCCCLFILYSPVYLLSRKTANVILTFFCVLVIIGHAMLVSYFLSALNPLGADLYHYTFSEIKLTAGAALTTTTVILLVGVLILVTVFFVVVPRYIRLNIKTAVLLLVAGCVVSLFFGISPELKQRGSSEYFSNLQNNKSAYFYSQSFYYFTGWQEGREVSLFADAFVGSGNWSKKHRLANQFDYIDADRFPFLHAVDSADVLSHWFNKSDPKPDIVIVIVEGLGRAFSGRNAYLGSFTPFLDSLASQSLYWENCLSAGGRTFAVLPSVLGSLPFGENGFAELGDKMPRYLGLVNILRHNGYRSRFIYAGNSGFDNMNLFMQGQHTDEILDENDFGPEYKRLPGNASGFSWGYGDFDLYQRYFQAYDKRKDAPSVNVILTISTHSPFLVPKQERYRAKLEQMLGEFPIGEREKLLCRENHQQLETVLYMDEAMRWFFSEYSKREVFKNTVFVLTGDHRMPDIPMSTKIDRYHVPLFIYSPLLRSSQRFSSVVSHLDITPSLLALLNTDYEVEVPSYTCWVGAGLDTTTYFSNRSMYPLMQTKSGISDLISSTEFINQGNLYSVNAGMQLDPDNDATSREQLSNDLRKQKQYHSKLNGSTVLYPDSLLKRFDGNQFRIAP